MAVTLREHKQRDLPAALEGLVRLMPPVAIRDDVDHGNTLEMIDRLMQVERLSRDQAQYLETLVELVESYEAKRHALDLSGLGGLRMLKHVMEQSGMSASDLARLLKVHASMGSKILQGQRRLTWEHAKILAAEFKVSPVLFMDEAVETRSQAVDPGLYRWRSDVKLVKNSRRSSAQDQGDAREALRRLKNPADREVPYAEARRRLGLE